MIDFNPGVGRMTMVDGFTIRNLPKQNHRSKQTGEYLISSDQNHSKLIAR